MSVVCYVPQLTQLSQIKSYSLTLVHAGVHHLHFLFLTLFPASNLRLLASSSVTFVASLLVATFCLPPFQTSSGFLFVPTFGSTRLKQLDSEINLAYSLIFASQLTATL